MEEESLEQRNKRLTLAKDLFSELLGKAKADIECPPEVIDELENDLKLCEDEIEKIRRVEEPGEDKEIEINFTNRYVMFNTNKENKRYALLLIENIILHEELHWLWGFIYLPLWTKPNRTLSSQPKKLFGDYFNKEEAKKFINSGLTINSDYEKDKWLFKFDELKQNLKCNLFEVKEKYYEAKKLYDRAQTLLKQNNVVEGTKVLEEAIKVLEIAISPAFYPNIRFVDAYNLLIKCFLEKEFKNISPKLRKKTEYFISWYVKQLDRCISTVKRVYLKKIPKNELPDLEYELKRIEREKENAEKYHRALLGQNPLSKKEEEYQELMLLIEDVVEEARFEYSTVKSVTHETCQSPAFDELKKNMFIKHVYETSSKYFMTKDSYLTREESIPLCSNYLLTKGLIEIIKSEEEGLICIKSRELDNLETAEEIRDYLIEKVTS